MNILSEIAESYWTAKIIACDNEDEAKELVQRFVVTSYLFGKDARAKQIDKYFWFGAIFGVLMCVACAAILRYA